MQVILNLSGENLLLNISGAQLEVLQNILQNATPFAETYLNGGVVQVEASHTFNYKLELPAGMVRLMATATAANMKEEERQKSIKTACTTFFESDQTEEDVMTMTKALYYADVLNYDEYDPAKQSDVTVIGASEEYPGPEEHARIVRKDGKRLRYAPADVLSGTELHIYRDRIEFQ